MTETLPLFPLGTVLFPGLVLPLHVFEERYRTLVEDLLELPEPERRFGVVAIREGFEVGASGVRALYDVGCVAQLRGVDPREDGSYEIVTTGTDRFRLHGSSAASTPYLCGEAELLPDGPGDGSEAAVLAAAVSRGFGQYLHALASAQEAELEPPELPDDPVVLSYLVAATVMVDLADRQSLLAEPDVPARLAAERRLLHRETGMLRILSAAPAPDLTRTPMSAN